MPRPHPILHRELDAPILPGVKVQEDRASAWRKDARQIAKEGVKSVELAVHLNPQGLHDPCDARVEDIPPPLLCGRVVPGRRQPPSAPTAAVVVVVSAKVIVIVVLGSGAITPRTLASSSNVVVGIGSARMATASQRASDLAKSELPCRMAARAAAFNFASRSVAVNVAVVLVRLGGGGVVLVVVALLLSVTATAASMRMSSGPLAFHVNPLDGSLTCINEHPRLATRANARGRQRRNSSLATSAKEEWMHSRRRGRGSSLGLLFG